MAANSKTSFYSPATLPDNDYKVCNQPKQNMLSGINTVLLWSFDIVSETKSKKTFGGLFWKDSPLVAVRNGKAVFDPDKQFAKLNSRLSSLQSGNNQ